MESSLSYDPASLKWNDYHTQNEEEKYCYCGKPRTLFKLSLYCETCNNWFHKECLSIELADMLPFTLNYKFYCLNCSTHNYTEILTRTKASWRCIMLTTFHNLFLELREQFPDTTSVKGFVIKDQCHFIARNWERLCHGRVRNDANLIASICTAFSIHNKLFPYRLYEGKKFYYFVGNPLDWKPNAVNITADYFSKADLVEFFNVPFSTELSCRNIENSSCRPGKTTEEPVRAKKEKTIIRHGKKQILANQEKSCRGKASSNGSPLRGLWVNNSVSVKEEFNEETAVGCARAPYACSTTARRPRVDQEHVYNRNGYRYIDVEPDPFAREVDCFRRAQYDELNDCAPQLKIQSDYLTIEGHKGYCLARATHAVGKCVVPLDCFNGGGFKLWYVCEGEGTWYYEVLFEKSESGAGHVRIGWAQEYANVQAPVGYDEFSYSYRDVSGTKFHKSIGTRMAWATLLGTLLAV
ncbi:uncharacterized protein LOC135144410 isoform X2 [Zophobas morio]|uniref:uncharacterized protein LOC135144410 isoform X2 n=1 Tax=Zophobas morio TaxID=2755281 RepID=UPI00308362EA